MFICLFLYTYIQMQGFPWYVQGVSLGPHFLMTKKRALGPFSDFSLGSLWMDLIVILWDLIGIELD